MHGRLALAFEVVAGFGVVFVGWERNIGLVTGMEVCGQKV